MRIRRTISLVRWFESGLIGSGWFVLQHDGSKEPTDIRWLDKPSFYTKMYRMRLDGRYVNTWIKFIYNLRDGWADFAISTGPPAMHGKVSAAEAAGRRMVRAMEVSTEASQETKALQANEQIPQ